MPGLLKLLEHGTNLILIMKDMLKDMYIQYRSKVSGQSIASRTSIVESRNFRGWSLENRVSSLEDRGSSFNFRVEKYELVVRAHTNHCSP